MTDLQLQRWTIEEQVLDAIHSFMRKHHKGTAREIADYSGLAVGKILEVLKSSSLVLKRCPRNPRTWKADWKDIDPQFRPRKGRTMKPQPPNIIPIKQLPQPAPAPEQPEVLHQAFRLVASIMRDNHIQKATLVVGDKTIDVSVQHDLAAS